MSTVENGVVVTLNHRVTDIDGMLVDDGDKPIVYLHGSPEGIFPKLAAALEGKRVGESITVTLPPEDAFGAFRDELILAEPRGDFPPDLAVDTVFEGGKEGEEGTVYFRVTAIEDEHVILDANHPLAGMTLIFNATVAAIRDATPEELAQEQWRPDE
ncbi:MAG: FKBP-type peptidyl-prolyl cis-trans isomerase [Alphaproteobacteria bacterium]|nr:FKBP-type peptidyl-prolyl cis-trans isomerase [Alphaproteobacteria bacterium]